MDEPAAKEGPDGTRRDTRAICKKGLIVNAHTTFVDYDCGFLYLCVYKCVSTHTHSHTHCIEA